MVFRLGSLWTKKHDPARPYAIVTRLHMAHTNTLTREETSFRNPNVERRPFPSR